MEPENLADMLRIVTGPLGDQIDKIHDEREACAQRGYHRIADEPKKSNENELLICYDCELWFGTKDDFVTYRVEPL